jgi:hypothetical protein
MMHSHQAMSMLASFQNMAPALALSGLPGFAPVLGLAGAAGTVGSSQNVLFGQASVPEPAIHPNLELAGEFANLQRELQSLCKEVKQKQPAPGVDGSEADDEAGLLTFLRGFSNP